MRYRLVCRLLPGLVLVLGIIASGPTGVSLAALATTQPTPGPAATRPAATQPTVQEALQADIEQAIALLEKKDYAAFFKRFSPRKFAQMTADLTLDDHVRSFATSTKPQRLLTDLKAARGAVAEVSPDGTKAMFKGANGNSIVLIWNLVDGQWYPQ